MLQSKTVAFHTLGCKLNFAETSTIARQLKSEGYTKVDFIEAADVYIINTCSVTENADKECKLIVGRALAKNENAFIAIIGCYAQLKPEQIASIKGVDVVLGATEKFNISKYITEKKNKTEIFSCEIADATQFVSSYSTGDRTRAFLKVQDGCDYTCSFCTIPLARGKSRSNSISNVLAGANEVVAQGAKEVVLTGVNLGDFGNNDGEDFYQLALQLERVEGLERIRISSIEPNLLSTDIINLVSQSKKFVPHFHIPLQSGSNKILKLMRRRYLRELYSQRVQNIKSLMPHCCIGADVITGFPGETEDDFLDTYRFLNELNISYLHVFTYSERDHTHALSLKDVVDPSERKRRTHMLRILSEKKLRAFYEENTGKILPVLFEADNKNGFMHGFTDNYIKVKTPFDADLVNMIVSCKTELVDENGDVTVSVLQTEIKEA